ncbi:MAG TPA: hypothetical protein VEX40_17540, partial [Mycobacterium sp.]|nr:hypothetical protein [Mycobacterium sp.]
MPRITLTSPRVSTASVGIATHRLTSGVGSVAPLRIPPYISVDHIPSVDGVAAWLLQLMYGGILNGAIEPTPEVSLWVAMLTEAVLTLGLVSVILGTASGARNVGDQRRDRHRRLHRPGVGVGRAGVGFVDEPGPLARPRA